MLAVLEDYLTIYLGNNHFAKRQRKFQHIMIEKWSNTRYDEMPSFDETMAFMQENVNTKYVKQFYEKLLFADMAENNSDVYASRLLFLFEQGAIRLYEQYHQYVKSEKEFEDIVLCRYPDNLFIKQNRYMRMKKWFVYSVHEVPCFVLYANDAATREEIAWMKVDIDYYAALCAELNLDEKEFVNYITNLYKAWAKYLGNVNDYNGFQHYLESHHIEW